MTDEDIKTLEAILWGEVGTHDDYMHEYGEKSLSILVREITGLDQQAANKTFSAFLSDNDLNQEQIVFVNTIVNFVVRNGCRVGLIFAKPFSDMLIVIAHQE